MALELRTLVSTCRGVGQDVVMCEHGAQGWLLTETKWPVAVFHCSVNHAPVFPSYVGHLTLPKGWRLAHDSSLRHSPP